MVQQGLLPGGVNAMLLGKPLHHHCRIVALKQLESDTFSINVVARGSEVHRELQGRQDAALRALLHYCSKDGGLVPLRQRVLLCKARYDFCDVLPSSHAEALRMGANIPRHWDLDINDGIRQQAKLQGTTGGLPYQLGLLVGRKGVGLAEAAGSLGDSLPVEELEHQCLAHRELNDRDQAMHQHPAFDLCCKGLRLPLIEPVLLDKVLDHVLLGVTLEEVQGFCASRGDSDVKGKDGDHPLLLQRPHHVQGHLIQPLVICDARGTALLEHLLPDVVALVDVQRHRGAILQRQLKTLDGHQAQPDSLSVYGAQQPSLLILSELLLKREDRHRVRDVVAFPELEDECFPACRPRHLGAQQHLPAVAKAGGLQCEQGHHGQDVEPPTTHLPIHRALLLAPQSR
mmetsp:Transcript_25166/g.70342  ORF Transcript_25166/g.70342 Transcript_25166/m.70342 type:complete len:400 (+) Transcript_25166:1769-2968(+)